MAEFLIYNKDHWMDNINQEEYNKLVSTPEGQQKYLARYQRGDIVEVREDGFYTSTLKGDLSKWPFRVVVVKDLNDDVNYTEPLMQGNKIIKRRRYNTQKGVTKPVYTVTKIEDITLIDKSSQTVTTLTDKN
jgi:hypothetical protein